MTITAVLTVNTADDMHVIISSQVVHGQQTLYFTADTESKAREMIIDHLQNSKLFWVRTYEVQRGDINEQRDYSAAWNKIRDLALTELRNGSDQVHVGGNWAISVEFHK